VAVLRILGIDPGTRVVGYGCLEVGVDATPAPLHTAPLALRAANVVRAGGNGSVRTVDCGVLRLGGSDCPVAERLSRLADRLRALLAALQPHELALEEAFCGKSVQAALRIGEARGVLLAEAARAGLRIHEYPPARIKRCVAGRGDAGKDTVARLVLQQLGVCAAPALPTDASDALAAALTRLEERRSPLLNGLPPDLG
jgi:crossover junction endodeoxyribonuclease RuvC